MKFFSQILFCLALLSACADVREPEIGDASPSASTRAVIPGAPTGLTTIPGNEQVDLSWTAPSDTGGSPITDYTIQYSSNSGTSWNDFVDEVSPQTSATVTGLTNGTEYTFQVAAVNAAGAGSFATTDASVVPATIAGAPTGVVGTSGNTQVTLSWTAPGSTGGNAITDYVVQYSSNSGSSWTSFSDGTSTNTTATVTGLINGTAYVFRVAAVNSDGTGNYAQTSSSVTPATTPGTSTSVAGTSGNTQVALTWTAPSSNGGAFISDYVIEVSSNGGGTWISFTDGESAATSAVVTGLVNGTEYIFQVAAVNSAGAGMFSSSSLGITPLATPDPPTGLSAIASDGGASLSWTAPTNNGGSAITDYAYQYSTDGGTTWSAATLTASTSTSKNLTGLANNVPHVFRVAAVNTVGTGNFSESSSMVTPQGAFVSTWKTNNTSTGSSTSTQVKLPLESTGTYNFTVDWGDGLNNTITAWNDANVTHTYAAAGTYTVTINGTITGFRFNNTGDRLKLTDISKWGPLKLGNNGNYFYGASNLTISSTEVLDLTGTTNLAGAFRSCTSLITSPSMANWNTSNVTDMNYMFSGANKFNQDIGNWNTSNVTNMGAMFYLSTVFNQPIGNWNTSNVTSMGWMFQGAAAFDQDIGSWNTANVTDMTYVFASASNFNQNISSWNTSNVTGMNGMFNAASNFNQPIGNWNTNNLTNMSFMFENASIFNQDIGSWNTAKVTTMNRLFNGASAFNQNIGNWNTSNVTVMSQLFSSTPFNQPIGNWNTSKVTAMDYLFSGATAFNQDIGSWNTANVTNMNQMFNSASAFNQNVSNWNTSNVTNMYAMFRGANAFNQEIGNWDVSKVTEMSAMFTSAGNFNQNIGNWNTANVTSAWGMFQWAGAFNQNIGSWNTSKITNFYVMFNGAASFNQPIGSWNTANATRMDMMFLGATAFNQPVGNWNTVNVTNMSRMFEASPFNQDVSLWNVTKVTTMSTMFLSSSLDRTNYDSLLLSWSAQNVKTGVTFSAGNTKFSFDSVDVVSARTLLTSSVASGGKGWTITDGGGFEEPTDPPKSCSGDCFSGDLAVGSKRQGPDGSIMVLEYANGSSGFKVWKEENGSRILNASGLIEKGWQKNLNRAGTAFEGDLTSSVVIAQIGGRVCPTNVFLDFSNMAATDRCLYYDTGNAVQRLDDANPDTGGPSGALESEDWLMQWSRAGTGRTTNSSYFEGNIKTCADKGMRLPTIYETTMTAASSNRPTGDLIANGGSLSAHPTFATTNGVPSFSSHTWTASASTNHSHLFWTWSGTASSTAYYDGWYGTCSSGCRNVRCVLPNNVSTAGLPTSVNGTAGNTEVSLSWTAPSENGGAAITDYIVQYKLSTDSSWSAFSDGTSTNTTATVTGLTNGSAYDFQVAAVNSAGTGSYAQTSSSVTPASTPGAPTSVSGTSGNTQVALSWTEPVSNGGALITDYAIEYSSNGGSTWVSFTDGVSATASAVVTGLANGTEYVFQVAAINAAGTGSFSTASLEVTPYTAPGAPTSVSGTAGDEQVSLSWTAPSNDGGSAITDYVIQYSSNSGTDWTTFSDGTSTSTNTTVTGLTNGTAYIFKVAAVNSAGTGSYAQTSSSITPQLSDTTPPAVTLSSSSSSSTNSAIPVTVTFTESVTGFDASDVTVTNGSAGIVSGSGSSYSFTVTPDADGAVSVSVAGSKAQDAAGNQNTASNTLNFTYDATAPSSPSVSINSGATYTTTTLVDLTISATGSPTEMYVTNTAGCGSGGTWEAYSTSKTAWVLSQTNHTATVYAKFKDAAGNESTCESDTIIHDNTAPTSPTISINNDAATTNSTSVTLTLSATGATQMYVTSTAGCSSGGTTEAYSTSKSWTLTSGDGTRTVYVKYLDEAGNASSCASDDITLLPAPPPDPSSFTATVDQSTQITVSWNSGGGTTDKFQVAYQTGSTAPADCETGTVVSHSTIGTSTSTAITVSAATDYAFRVCARDTYGQLSNGVTANATTGWYNEAYLKASNAEAGDSFGYSLSISGDTVVIGTYAEDSNQTTITNGATASSDNTSANSGAAYVFKRTGNSWSQEAYLKSSNSGSADWFGYTVSVSGDTIVVGAYQEDSNQTTITNGTTSSDDNSVSGSGAAYVFKRTGSTWSQEAYLKAPNLENSDYFGTKTSVSGDTIVVGAYGEDSNQTTITNGTTASGVNGKLDSGAVYVFKRSGSNWSQEAYIKPPNPQSALQFSNAVISGDTIAVGASHENSNQTTITNGTTASSNTSKSFSGAVYAFKRTGTTWAQEAYIKAPNADTYDNFGTSISLSGDTIIAGASGEDSNQTTITSGSTASSDNSATTAGAAYIFFRSGSTWSQEAYLKSPNAESLDNFGVSAAISGDTVVVGAQREDSNQTTITNGSTANSDNSISGSGAVYVFKRTGSTWAQEAYLKAPNNEANDLFGASAAISGDTILITASGESSNQTTITNGTTASSDNSAGGSGAAYVFRRAATVGLTPAITSVSPSSFSAAGGGVVSIFGSGFQIGATVTVGGTTCTNPVWQGYNEILCTLPSGTSGSATVVVTNPGGANGASSSAFSYVVPPDPTSLTATVDNSTQITLNWASGGGSTATYQVAYQAGSTAPANCSSGTVVSYSTIGASTSAAITVSAATDYAFRVCARDTYGQFSSGVTTTATTGWYQEAYLKASNSESNDLFGYSTAISGDTIVVGAYGEASTQTTITNGTTSAGNGASTSGAAYVFKRTGNAWTQEAYLKASNSESGDYFGWSTSVSGNTIVVGAYVEDSTQTTITNGTTSAGNGAISSGAAYVFKRTGNAWTQEAYLKASNSESSDFFGCSTAISGDTIVVGAYREASTQTTITNGTTSAGNGAISSGAAYVFKRTGNAWTQEAYLKASNSGSSDYFGYSTAISGDTIVVGAYGEASTQTTITNGTTSAGNGPSSSGAAYVFKRTGNAWTQEAYLKASNSGSGDLFGYSTAISGDTIVVGAYEEDSTQTTITNGTTSAGNGASYSGAAYVFKRTGNAWTQEAYLKASNSESGDTFGSSTAISGDTIVVGADGEASTQTTITNGTTSAGNGASTSGAAYVFKRTGNAWTQEAYLKASNSESGDTFGSSTAISGDTIVVGADGEASTQTTITNGTTSAGNGADQSGAAYVFRRAETNSTPAVTSVTPNTGGTSGMNAIIFGSGFRKDATVTIGGTACTSTTVQGPNEIICTLPSKSAGAQAIVVTNPGGSASNSNISVTY